MVKILSSTLTCHDGRKKNRGELAGAPSLGYLSVPSPPPLNLYLLPHLLSPHSSPLLNTISHSPKLSSSILSSLLAGIVSPKISLGELLLNLKMLGLFGRCVGFNSNVNNNVNKIILSCVTNNTHTQNPAVTKLLLANVIVAAGQSQIFVEKEEEELILHKCVKLILGNMINMASNIFLPVLVEISKMFSPSTPCQLTTSLTNFTSHLGSLPSPSTATATNFDLAAKTLCPKENAAIQEFLTSVTGNVCILDLDLTLVPVKNLPTFTTELLKSETRCRNFLDRGKGGAGGGGGEDPLVMFLRRGIRIEKLRIIPRFLPLNIYRMLSLKNQKLTAMDAVKVLYTLCWSVERGKGNFAVDFVTVDLGRLKREIGGAFIDWFATKFSFSETVNNNTASVLTSNLLHLGSPPPVPQSNPELFMSDPLALLHAGDKVWSNEGKRQKMVKLLEGWLRLNEVDLMEKNVSFQTKQEFLIARDCIAVRTLLKGYVTYCEGEDGVLVLIRKLIEKRPGLLTTVIQQKLDEKEMIVVIIFIPPPTEETYLSAALKKMPLGTQKNILANFSASIANGPDLWKQINLSFRTGVQFFLETTPAGNWCLFKSLVEIGETITNRVVNEGPELRWGCVICFREIMELVSREREGGGRGGIEICKSLILSLARFGVGM